MKNLTIKLGIPNYNHVARQNKLLQLLDLLTGVKKVFLIMLYIANIIIDI